MSIIEKNIKFEKNFISFKTFYEETQDLIYRTIIDEIKTIEFERDKKIVLKLNAIINDFEWTHVFSLTKDSIDLIVTTIIPYYESTQNYEYCNELLKLYNKLKEQ